MVESGFEISLAGLRMVRISDEGSALVKGAFQAYHRQLANWWPDRLFIRCDELRKGANDDARRECLATYLQAPASGGFPRDAPSDMGGKAVAGTPPTKVRQVLETASTSADPKPTSALHATPVKTTPVESTPAKALPAQAFTPS
eukprot:2656629-Pyramimonas_sp.AAC.1